jgi:hypothetical protein
MRHRINESHIFPKARGASRATPDRLNSQSAKPITKLGPIKETEGGVGLIKCGPSARGEKPRAMAATAKVRKQTRAVKNRGLRYAPKVPVQDRCCMELVSLRNANTRV